MNMLERLNREIKRRRQAVRIFPNSFLGSYLAAHLFIWRFR
jgi:transposase-like protein